MMTVKVEVMATFYNDNKIVEIWYFAYRGGE